MEKPNIQYSCCVAPQEFTTLYYGKDVPVPIDGHVYRWHIVNFTEDMDNYKVILAFQKAITDIQRVVDQVEPVGPYLSFESTSDISKADFVFSFGKGRHKIYSRDGSTRECLFSFDGSLGVLAHVASNDRQGIHFDEDENWADMSSTHPSGKRTFSLYRVFLHEFLHCLRLGHSNIRGAVMWPSEDESNTGLHDDDKKGIHHTMADAKKKVYKKYFKDKVEKEQPESEVKKKTSWIDWAIKCIKDALGI